VVRRMGDLHDINEVECTHLNLRAHMPCHGSRAHTRPSQWHGRSRLGGEHTSVSQSSSEFFRSHHAQGKQPGCHGLAHAMLTCLASCAVKLVVDACMMDAPW